MRWLIVWKFVSRPPSQRLLTYGMPALSATSLKASRACFLVPQNRIRPPRGGGPLLLVRADEQDRAAAAGELAGEVLGLRQQPLRLQQVDDVDPAALAVD